MSVQQALHDGLGDRGGDGAAAARPEHSTVAATATFGLRAGAKAMNQVWTPSCPVHGTSAVPVLPATSMPVSAAAVPVPSRTTFCIIAVDLLRRSEGFITVDLDLRLDRLDACARRGRRRGRRGAGA